MKSYRNKKPQKNRRKDDLHQDNPTFWQNDKFYKKRWNFLNQQIESGTVLYHTAYHYFAIFLFVDGNEPYFVTSLPMSFGTNNNPHMFRLATNEEAIKFHQEMSENGYEIKNNRLYHNKKPINYPTNFSFSMYGVHRKKYKRRNKRLFYGGREI